MKKITFIISALILVSPFWGDGRGACQGIYNNGATIVIPTGF